MKTEEIKEIAMQMTIAEQLQAHQVLTLQQLVRGIDEMRCMMGEIHCDLAQICAKLERCK